MRFFFVFEVTLSTVFVGAEIWKMCSYGCLVVSDQ